MSYFDTVKQKGEKGANQGIVLEEILFAILMEMKKMNLQLALVTDVIIDNEEVE